MKNIKTFENYTQDQEELDYDYILDKLKDKGWGDISPNRFEKFERSKHYSGTIDNDEYTAEFDKYLYNKSIGN